MVCQITGLASHQNVFEDAHSYATCMQHLISVHKKDVFKAEKCQSFIKVTKFFEHSFENLKKGATYADF